jgi:hypothetical protein
MSNLADFSADMTNLFGSQDLRRSARNGFAGDLAQVESA